MSEIRCYEITYNYWKGGVVGSSCLTGITHILAYTAEDALTQFRVLLPEAIRIAQIDPVKEQP